MTTADVLAFFPKCSVCGRTIEPTDAVELDPDRVCRVKHTGCQPLQGAA